MRPGAMLFSLSANCNSATPDCPFRLSARALGEGIRVCSATAELLRCSKAAAVGTGFICAGLARNSFTKPFMNGLPMPSENARGPRRPTRLRSNVVNHGTPRFEPLPSNGCVLVSVLEGSPSLRSSPLPAQRANYAIRRQRTRPSLENLWIFLQGCSSACLTVQLRCLTDKIT